MFYIYELTSNKKIQFLFESTNNRGGCSGCRTLDFSVFFFNSNIICLIAGIQVRQTVACCIIRVTWILSASLISFLSNAENIYTAIINVYSKYIYRADINT